MEVASALVENGCYESASALISAQDLGNLPVITRIKALLLLGESLSETQQYHRSAETFKRAFSLMKQLKTEPENRYRVVYAKAAMRAGLYDQVIQALKIQEATLEMCNLLAKAHEFKGELKQAASFYLKLYRANPLDIAAGTKLVELGLDLVPSNSWQSSYIQAFSKSFKRDYVGSIEICDQIQPAIEVILQLKAKNLVFLGRFSEACDIYYKLKSADPLLVDGMDYYAECLVELGKRQLIHSLANDLLLYSKNRPEPWLVLAKYCIGKDQLHKALYFSAKSLEINSTPFALQVKAEIHLKLKQYEKSLELYKKAFVKSPDIYSIRGIVNCFIKQDKAVEAVAFLNTISVQNNQLLLLLVGRCYRKIPDYKEKGTKILEKCMLTSPDSFESFKSLLECYTDENHEKALELIKKVQFNRFDYYLLIGYVYTRLQKYESAFDAFNRAHQLEPHSKELNDAIKKLERLVQGEQSEQEESDGDFVPEEDDFMDDQ